MSCPDFEERLARGEEPAAREVRDHLAVCADCREFEERLRQARLGLSSLRDDLPDEAEMSRLRAQIVDAASRQRRPLARVSVARLAAVAFFFARQPPTPGPPTPPSAVSLKTPEPAVRSHPRTNAAARRAPSKPPKVEHEEATRDLVVKLVTDDPNVVIIWLVSTSGGTP